MKISLTTLCKNWVTGMSGMSEKKKMPDLPPKRDRLFQVEKRRVSLREREKSVLISTEILQTIITELETIANFNPTYCL